MESAQMQPEARDFIPTDRPESWLEHAQISFSQYSTRIVATLTGENTSFSITPAYRFLQIEGGDGDSEELIGAVKTRGELERLNAEVFRDSVIVGENAYKVEIGYVKEPRNGNGASALSHRASSCLGCIYLSHENDTHHRIYRCTRFRRAIFAAFSYTSKGDGDSILPLNGDCYAGLQDDRWYAFTNATKGFRRYPDRSPMSGGT